MDEDISVLHVDDEPEFAETAAAFLEREDERFDVETATGADEALERLAGAEGERDGGTDVDCVVSDYEMPGRNGIEFLRAVREEYPDLPFILYTGKGSEEIASEAITVGVSDYLQKEGGTSQYAVLANRIENAVEQRRAERRVAERETELQRVSEQFEYLVEGVPDGLFLIADDYSETYYVNSAAEDLYGVDVETVRTDPTMWMEHVHPEDRERLLADVAAQRAGDTDGPQHQEFRIQHPERGTRWLEVEIHPITEDGEVERLAGIATDVTERRERAEELARYERIVEDLDDVATVIDPNGTITYVSPSVRRLLGYDPEDLIGEDGFAYQPPNTAQTVGEAMEYVLQNPGESRTVQTKFRRADGSYCWVESTLRNRLEEEMIGGILVSSRDVTERRERRDELRRQNERLEEFASVVSHDLRSPLGVARGRLELLGEDCDSEHLDPIDRALSRMDDLIENLLALAREGERVSETEPVALARLADAAWADVVTHDAALEVEVDDSVRVEADENRLRQLFENLYRNAIEHGGDDVTVTVGDHPERDGFYVADDGPGIPADEHAAVFDAGYSTAAEGTGFGLSIVEQVATAHGWSIAVTDGADGGARFEVAEVGVPTGE